MKSSRFGLSTSSLRTQLLVSYVIICLVTLSLGYFFIYHVMTSVLLENYRSSTYSEFKRAESTIGSYVEETTNLIKVFSASDSVQRLINEDLASYGGRLEMYSQFIRNASVFFTIYRSVDSLFVYTEDGYLFGTSKAKNWNIEPAGLGKKKALWEELQACSGTNAQYFGCIRSSGLQDFLTDDAKYAYSSEVLASSIHYITIARQFHSITTDESGMIVANTNERVFNSLINGVSTGSSTIYIIDEKGRIVSHSNPDNIGQLYGVYADMIGREPGRGDIVYRKGDQRIHAFYYPLGDVRWLLVKEVPESEISASLKSIRDTMVIALIIGILISIWYSFFVYKKMSDSLKKLLAVVREVQSGNIGFTVSDYPKNEIGEAMIQLNDMSLSIKSLIHKNKEYMEERNALELEMLRYQINPHFVFNTLNTIKWMAKSMRADNIADSLTLLGNLLRPVYNNGDIMCTLKEEIDYIENYARIMNLRYGNDAKIDIDITEDVKRAKVLRFILQPIVENCFKHAFIDSDAAWCVQVGASVLDGRLKVCVKDNGAGLSDEVRIKYNNAFAEFPSRGAPAAEGIGLMNVDRRIKLHYGEGYGLHLEGGQGRGASVYVLLPFLNEAM